MWIAGLSQLRKPFVHLHTQFNRDIPWSQIDMDFMNLATSPPRRAGSASSPRMRINRKVIVGHWQEDEAQDQLAIWMRRQRLARRAGARIARFGDNMRKVAVTEGDKVRSVQLGYSVYGYGSAW
jgi:L-arabinose isomerase